MMSARACALAAATVCAGLAVLAGCGGGSASRKSSSPVLNTAPLVVNAGPIGNYANGLFTTVTICAPGTSTCQAISGVLVDTGSFGLRILASALTAAQNSALPVETDADGNSIVECAEFSDGITWGPVVTADVKIGGEQASAIPVQIIGDQQFSNVPSGCSSMGAPEDTVQKLMTNGILGIGNFVQDCPACGPGTVDNPGLYYSCASSSCSVTTVAIAQQVANPVASFSTDNNGVVVQLPAATSSEATLSGTLLFGIGTRGNNALGDAQVLTIDPSTGNFSTTFKNQTYSDTSFLDTGSNGFFFLDSSTTGLPACKPANGFYCPSSQAKLSATNIGTNDVQSTVSFTIDNATSLFSVNGNAVFPTLGGPLGGLLDWGLPFFYGRSVYVAIFGASTPGGVGPYWAY
jgi:uncharacterized protein DUF3443